MKIGIMQGRVIPEQLDKLQVFPLSNWKKELTEIRKTGFSYMELLFDKDLVLEKLLLDPANREIMGINNNTYPDIPGVHSICVDYLASLSLKDKPSERLYFEKLVNLIEMGKDSTIDVLVIPFFDDNPVTTKDDLEFVLDWITESRLNETAFANGIILALELSLPADHIHAALSGRKLSNIKVCYDLGNAKADGYSPEEEILLLNDLIAHVHIKDRKVNGPNVMLGDGDVNFEACFRSLKQVGYDGLMILETRYYNEPVVEASKNFNFINDIILNIC